MSTLGDLIAQLREAKGWSAKELARRCTIIKGGDKPVSGTHINRLERDEVENPGMEFIRIVAKALGVDPIVLFGAYLGIDPKQKNIIVTPKEGKDSKDESKQSTDAVFEALFAFIKTLPDKDIAEIIKGREQYILKELDRMDREEASRGE